MLTSDTKKQSTDRMVCQLKDVIKSQITNQPKALINDVKQQVSNQVENISHQVQSNLDNVEMNIINQKDQIVSQVNQTYQQTPIPMWRSLRPDITLLVEISICVGLALLLYSFWPYLTGTDINKFTQEQYLKALYLPESTYSVKELGDMKLTLKAFQDYYNYFNSTPYSPENQGMNDLAKGNIFLPIISFLAIYILPPFIVLYSIWFIWTYFKQVFEGLIALGYMIGYYALDVFECKLASKWYIRLFLGWSEDCPSFGERFTAWRREYVDKPVRIEQLKYIEQYYAARKRYYEIPRIYYYDLPKERYQIQSEYLKKIYVDRSTDVFLKKMLDSYGTYVDAPKKELYRYVLGKNENLAALWAKVRQSKQQVTGQPYESITTRGKTCSCPATQTPISGLNQIANQTISTLNTVKDNLKPSVQIHLPNCEQVDQVLATRSTWFRKFVVLTTLIIGGFLFYIHQYGTPYWLQRLMGPTWKFATGLNLRPYLKFKLNDYSVFVVTGIVLFVIGLGLYKTG